VIYFIIAAGAASLILAFWLLKSRRRIKPIEAETQPSQISLHVSTSSEEINVVGNTDEYIITVDNQFDFLVRDGVIVGYKDSTKSNVFKTYSEVE
jgi:hypothetical protein